MVRLYRPAIAAHTRPPDSTQRARRQTDPRVGIDGLAELEAGGPSGEPVHHAALAVGHEAAAAAPRIALGAPLHRVEAAHLAQLEGKILGAHEPAHVFAVEIELE